MPRRKPGSKASSFSRLALPMGYWVFRYQFSHGCTNFFRGEEVRIFRPDGEIRASVLRCREEDNRSVVEYACGGP